MSMFLYEIDWTKKQNSKECFSNFEKVKNYTKRFPSGRWSFFVPGEEDKWHGTHTNKPERQWTHCCRCHGCHFQRQRTSNIPRYKCVKPRILENERWKMYDPFQCRVSECRAFYFAQFTQQQWLSGYLVKRTWPRWNLLRRRTTSYLKNLNRKKRIPWYRHQGGMIKQRETACVYVDRDLKNYRTRSKSRKLVNLVDSWGESPIGVHYKTIHNVDDGFARRTGACREYTLLREEPGSEIIAWIGGQTKFGPVLQVQTTCRLDIYGVETQVPSRSGDGSASWVIISRGSNRYVEELQYNGPDYSPESRELANYTSVGKPHAILASTEELVRHSREHNRIWWATIPKILLQLTKGRGMIFLPMMMSEERLWSVESLNSLWSWHDILTWKIEKLMVQFNGNRRVQSCDTRFRKKADTPSLILNGLMTFGMDAIKLGFNIARTPTTFSCIFAPFEGILEENWMRLCWWIMSPFHSVGMNSCITEDAFF